MTPLDLALLVAAAALGGALNAVAGGGSFFTFPALLLAGVAPIPANATSALALWPASLASAGAYREDLRHERRVVVALGLASLAGGLLGAVVLLATPAEVFRLLVPWLLLGATLVFALAPQLLRRLGARHGEPSARRLAVFAVVWLGIATYGGYFGGGMGLLMLATLAAMGMEDIHAMNGLKVVLGATLNGVAIVAFAVSGVLVWDVALLMGLGAVGGGFGGARLAKRVDPAWVRRFVVVVGASLTAYFFATTYGWPA